MRILEVLIEHRINALNRPFSYVYFGIKEVRIGFRVLINFNNRQLVGYVVKVEESSLSLAEYEREKGFDVSEILDVIDDEELLNRELMELVDRICDHYLVSKISVLQTMLPKSLKPRLSSLKGPKVYYDKYLVVIDEGEEGLTPRQIDLLRLVRNNGKILKRDAGSPSIVDKLIHTNHFKIVEVERFRLEIPEYQKETIKILNDEQKMAIQSILNTDKSVSLLQGVTGSGKTEVYLALSEAVIEAGRNVLMLVPEIALTPIMVEYFQRRFKGDVAILHSELTEAEKYDEYRRIAKGECRIVVGARSAIFAPLDNIGLFVLDEEHVESYKQDVIPFYHAREIAIMRSEYHHAKVVLGSATPSLESKARALKGVYHYAELPHRINEQVLPKVAIIDLSNPRSLTRQSVLFSEVLIDKIRDRLAKREQIVLLINRRGFSGYVTCRSCGHIFKCPDCGITLTYHRQDEMLKCHHCNHVEFAPKICPECGGTFFSKSGFGTERIIDELAKLFPEARTLRLDSDVGRVRNTIAKTLEAFRNREADILVGTQMIAKGHDFPDVTLVGIVLADIGLSLPSFRSSERAFELITQAVGRSGRAAKSGEAVIQTYNPNHYAIRLAAGQDYETFFKKEMLARKAQQYPPYTFLTSVQISSKNEALAIDTIHAIAEDIAKQNYEDVTILGPAAPYIHLEKDVHHRVLLIKYKGEVAIKNHLAKLLVALQSKAQINVAINVDPYNF
ncbi:MAG: primosomal protein N' [Bacilli bacterium]|jgi:primosomal protein N' (replication factor Y)